MLRAFDHARDYETFNAWWESHGEKAIPREALPKLGFINEGACCFLVQTDSSFALIEFLACSRENRLNKRLILEVAQACEDKARELNYRYLMAPLDKRSVANMAVKRFGWRNYGTSQLVAKELT